MGIMSIVKNVIERLRLHDHARTAAVRVIVHAVEFIC